MLKKIAFPLLVILISSIYLYTGKDTAILDDGDALYAHVAQQMERTGDWVTAYADGVRFLDKPPMMYWLMAISYKALGEGEFAARFPSALAVLGIAIVVFLLGRKAGDDSTGFIAAIAVAFCIGTFLFTRMVFPDILFVFFLTLSMYCFLEWYSDPHGPAVPALLFYASLAGAVLTKGMIGIFFPVATACLFLWWSGDWRRLRNFHLGKGSLLFLALAVPWHVVTARRNPGFLWYFFVNEQVLRFLGRRQPADYESIPLVIFWGLVLLWLFPWSVFLPAIKGVVSAPASANSHRRPVVLLSMIWGLVVLVFFSFSSRIEHYALPLFPPLALLLGMAISPDECGNVLQDQRRQRWVARGFLWLGILGALIGVVLIGIVVLWMNGRIHGGADSSIELTHLRAYKYYFAPLFDFPPHLLARLEHPLLQTLFALSAGLLGAWWLNRRGRRMRAVLVLAAMMIVFFLSTFQSLAVCQEVLSSRQFGQKLRELYVPGGYAVTVGDYETANSVNFYAPVPLFVYDGSAALLQWGLGYPDAPNRLLTHEQLDVLWNGPQRGFVIVPDDRIAGLGLAHCYPVLSSAGRTLLCNQPIPAPGF